MIGPLETQDKHTSSKMYQIAESFYSPVVLHAFLAPKCVLRNLKQWFGMNMEEELEFILCHSVMICNGTVPKHLITFGLFLGNLVCWGYWLLQHALLPKAMTSLNDQLPLGRTLSHEYCKSVRWWLNYCFFLGLNCLSHVKPFDPLIIYEMWIDLVMFRQY